MSGPKPVMHNGMGSNQGIWDTGATQNHRVGQRASLDDGRVYYYSRQSASGAIVAGNVLAAPLASVDFDDMVTGTHPVGETVINCTNVGSATYAANDLAEGYLCVSTGTTGPGWAVKILSHGTWAATTAIDVTVYDPIPVAINADARTHVVQNPWQDVVIMATAGAAVPAGVSNVAVAAGDTTPQFFWCQTWGTCSVTSGSSSALGDALMADTGTAGETLIATAGNPVIGSAMTVGVDGSFVFAFLTVAP